MEWFFQRASAGDRDGHLGSRVARLPIDANTVHVVRVRLDHHPDDAMDLLDAEERARAARFVFERDRRRFVAAHAWTRLVLARFLGCPPPSVRFGLGGHGKPYLLDTSANVCFNISHAGERALVAIAHDRPVGVDIEEHRTIEPLELAHRFFAREEIEALERLDDAHRAAAFFRCWTRKEAFIKGIGDGLSFPLDGFAVRIDEERSSQLLQGCRVAPEALGQWRIVALESEAGYEAAVAAAAGEWDVAEWDISAA